MSKSDREVDRFIAADEKLREGFPHLHSWLRDEDEVRRLLIKAQEDGTFLAVASGYGADGGPVVCFGVGYGPVGALYGIDRTIQANKWRFDKYAEGRKQE